MKPKYKSLEFMQSVGCPCGDLIRSGQYDIVKANVKRLNDYELMYYHCKVLKMPVSTYDKTGLIMAIFHNVIADYEQKEEDLQEAEQETTREAIRRANTRSRIYKHVVIWYGLLCLLVVVLMFYLWITIEC